MKYQLCVMLAAASALTFAADSKDKVEGRITESAKVFREINVAEDKGIPRDLLQKAECIGIVPGMQRAGFIVGGNYGKGLVVCRATRAGGWTAPSMVRVEGGSVGLQIGGGETDLVFVVMNKDGMDKLMRDKFTVGADASAMGGPVGRSAAAQTDAMMHAEILSYSRARGVFAGVSIDGSTLRPDKEDNQTLYGNDVSQQEILSGKVHHPPDAAPLYSALNEYAPLKTARR